MRCKWVYASDISGTARLLLHSYARHQGAQATIGTIFDTFIRTKTLARIKVFLLAEITFLPLLQSSAQVFLHRGAFL